MSGVRQGRVGLTDSGFEIRQRRRKRKPDTYHYRPLVESLEQRRLLTTVTGVDPLPDTHDALVTTDVSATFDAEINPSTVTAATFAVHGLQTGQVLESLSVSGDTVTLSPAATFHPGELVQATVTTGIENLGGEPLADPFAWQFRADVGVGNGLGTGVFGDSGQRLGSSDSRAVALGDVDGDGDLDAFVANSHPRPNKVWLNDGSGNFANNGQSLGNSSSRAVALGDVDGDGDLDAFVGNGRYPGAPNKVWLNDGSGSFSDSGQRLGSSDSRAVALGDVDGDGDLDAFVGNGRYPGAPNKVWLNDGSGSFSDSGQRLSSSYSPAVALGDLDGDGDLDAFVGNLSGGGEPNKVWLNDGSGTFSDSGQSLGNSDTFAVALGDVDGDGDLDAFVGNVSWGYTSAANKVWLNDGSGNFTDSGQSLGSSYSEAVALGDVDGDGDLDSFVGNGGYPGEPNTVWLNDGSGAFHDSGQRLGDSSSRATSLGDLDGDGDLDAWIGNQADSIWLNVNADQVIDLSISTTDGQLGVVGGQTLTYTITVTNEGSRDVFGALVTDDFPSVLTDITWTCTATEGSSCAGSGTGDIDETIDLLVGGTATFAATARVVSVPQWQSDLVANTATVMPPAGLIDHFPHNNTATDTNRLPEPGILPAGDAGLAFFPQVEVSVGDEPAWMAYGDVDGDVDLDLVVADRQAHAVWIELGNGDGTFASVPIRYDVGLSPAHVTIGDLDNDSDLDLIVTGGGTDSPAVSVLLNAGCDDEVWSGFADPIHHATSNGPASALVSDLDDDGNLDLVVATSEDVTVRLNQGDGTIGNGVTYTAGAGHRSATAGDFDGDSVVDLVVANEDSSDISLLLGQGDGTFEEQTQTYPVHESGPLSVITGDIDDDGDLDLGIAHNYCHLSVMRGRGDGSFEPGQLIDSIVAYPQSLAFGDVDADGDLDLAVSYSWARHNDDGGLVLLPGNGDGTFEPPVRVGQTEYHTTASSIADFDANGRFDLATVTESGVSLLLSSSPPTQQPLADFDSDGRVNGDDFLIWQAGFGIQTGATRYDGDADRDGDVDGDDFLIWQANFGGGAAAGNASAMPATRSSRPDRLELLTSRDKTVDETFAELDRASARWTKRSLRDELLDELSLVIALP